MKSIKKIIAIVLVLATLIVSAAAFAESKTAVNKLYATGDVNLRKDAGLTCKIITVIKRGEAVTRLDGIKKDDRGVIWYKVQTASGKTGWASAIYLHNNPAETGTVKTTGRVNLRSAANTSGKILKVLDKDVKMTYTAKDTDAQGRVWYMVTFDGQTGWISSKYAEKI